MNLDDQVQFRRFAECSGRGPRLSPSLEGADSLCGQPDHRLAASCGLPYRALVAACAMSRVCAGLMSLLFLPFFESNFALPSVDSTVVVGICATGILVFELLLTELTSPLTVWGPRKSLITICLSLASLSVMWV